jgi:hypothetical protein
MSLPRDRRVVSPSATAVPTQVGVTLVSTSSTAPQVTLEPLTSFKRSLEELGFTAPDEQGHRADSPIPVPSNLVSSTTPSIVADRGSTGSLSEPHFHSHLYIGRLIPSAERYDGYDCYPSSAVGSKHACCPSNACQTALLTCHTATLAAYQQPVPPT